MMNEMTLILDEHTIVEQAFFWDIHVDGESLKPSLGNLQCVLNMPSSSSSASTVTPS